MSKTVGILITGQNQFTPVKRTVDGGVSVQVIEGEDSAWSGTLTLQRRPGRDVDGEAFADDEDGWQDEATFTGITTSTDSTTTNTFHGDWDWRFGCLTGDYVDGKIRAFLGS